MNFEKDNTWLLVAWLPAWNVALTFAVNVTVREPCLAVSARSCSLAEY
jgi:hypothetical protein